GRALSRMALFCVRHNERRTLKAPRQFRLVRTLVTGRRGRFEVAESRDAPWLSCRLEEWVRRFGASLPMRMTASWFGSLDLPDTRLWRDRSRPQAGSPLIAILLAAGVPSRSKPGERSPVGRRNGLFETTKLMKEKRCATLLKLLD